LKLPCVLMLRRGIPPFFAFMLDARGLVEPGLRGLTRGDLCEGIRFFKHPKATPPMGEVNRSHNRGPGPGLQKDFALTYYV